MSMSISRPRLFEIADQPWCPAFIRAHTQAVLTFLWVHRIPPFQSRAPYERAADVLDSLIRHVEEEQGSRSEKGKDKLRVVDCCSGAGGPMPLIERKINAKRTAEGLPPVPILLSDLHPHLSSWTQHKSQSPTSSLSFLPQPVDATNAPEAIRKDRHIRTFCLSFHHFDEDGARRVLADAMRSAEAICILELQEADLCSFLTLAGIFPLVFLVTPFLQPSTSVLFFTYVIPLIPLVMLFDGWVSAWRTRRPSQIKRLAALASLTLSLEGGDKDGDCGSEWKWEHGRSTHTRPCGRMLWITGKKRKVEYDEDDQEAFYTDAETDNGL